MKKKLILIGLLPLAIIINLIARNSPFVAEYIFARGIYRLYAGIWGSITSIFPFSLMELGIIVLPIAAIVVIVLWIKGIIKNKGERLKRFGNGILNLICVLSVVVFWFTCFCGVNYHRYTVAEIMDLEVRDSSVEELNELCIYLADKASDLRKDITNEKDNGAMLTSYKSFGALTKDARKAYDKLGETYEQFDYKNFRAKPVLFSHFMSYTHIVGVYCVFSMETNINTDVPDYSIPDTVLHEMAHSYGFMREDEANFIAFMAGINSDSLEIQYSAYAHALILAGNKLAGKNYDLYNKLWTHYDQGIINDFFDNSEYWKQFEDTVIEEVSDAVNDTYLKVNDQKDGVESYGRMVDLLLAWHRQTNSK
ncbi:MAG: DUF3810 domain-containing protein [Lachnospiraceae bacterium]|nr:DUF3810 domain-containing protein [Lachnospiraceae bacterium]